MRKIFFLISFLFATFIIKSQDLSIKTILPEKIQAGKCFIVNVDISKKNVQNFALFQQKLPEGFVAKAINTMNGDFSFKKNKINIRWINLPRENNFSFSYEIYINSDIKGEFQLNGQISYIKNNDRETFFLPNKTIIVLDNQQKNQDLILKNKNEVKCIRQTPFMNENNEFIIRLLVSKGTNKKFAKVEEIIPKNYKVKEIESKNSIFTVHRNIVKFYWMDLPEESNFIVSYKLIPKKENTKIPKIDGLFSYVEGENIFEIKINEKIINLEEKNINNLVANIEDVNLKKLEKNNFKKNTKKAIKKVLIKKGNSKIKENQNNNNRKNNFYKDKTIKTLTYRIQIGASHQSIKINYFINLGITDKITEEQNNEWFKYIIGEFENYRTASNFLRNLRNTTKIEGAFIIAYFNNKRIKMKNAFVIENQ